jgi:hypothetical protein
MKLRPYQAPRRQPKINDMLYPPGSRQPGNVWVGAVVMNVPEPSGGPAVSPTPTPTTTITPTPSVTPTQTVTPTRTLTPTPTKTGTPTPTPTPSSSPLPPGFAEATTYLNAVITAGGSLNSTYSAATYTLFAALKNDSVYDKIYAFYPHIGGVSASHAINAKTPGSNNITFNGGWTFGNTTGSDPNGTNAYGVLGGCKPSVYGTQNDSSYGFYSLTNQLTETKDFGLYTAASGSEVLMMPYFVNQSPYTKVNASTPVKGTTTATETQGMFVNTRSNATSSTTYKNGIFVLSGTSNSIAAISTLDLHISAQLEDATLTGYSTRAHGFTYVGSGLTALEVYNLSIAINNFNTSMSRGVYTNPVDAYLSNVISNGGTLSSTISAATRTLFSSLVSSDLMGKLYAFYPHLGGVANSNGLNAKNVSTNQITFNGGWTFDLLNGSKPNGTNGYGSILNGAPNQFGSQNSSAVGALLTTAASLVTNGTDIGAMGSSSVRYYFSPYFNSTERPRMALNNTGADSFTSFGDQVSTFVQSRTGSTTIELYAEGSLVQTATRTSAAPDNFALVLGAENESGIIKNYSPRAQGFTFLSSGLSGAEASTITTIIKTWANTISRIN